MRRTVVWIGFVIGLVLAHYIPIGHPMPLERVVWCLIGGTLTLWIDWAFSRLEKVWYEARYGR
jgi:hypothetical protein